MTGQVNLAAGPESFRRSIAAGRKRMPPLLSKPVLEQYGLLAEAMDQASRDHIITPLPATRPESASEYSRSRLRTIRNRLFLLGYLERDSGRAALGPQLMSAITAFQQDARLSVASFVVDGWVGEQTWAALQELVSFEQPLDMERWFAGDVACPALVRAVGLRLFALGLARDHLSVISERACLEAALNGFVGVCSLLGVNNGTLKPELCPETLELLFDQDALVSMLALSKPPDLYVDKVSIKPFVLGMAKIELWLLGYDITPDGYAGGEVIVSDVRALDLKKTRLRNALTQYWIDSGMTRFQAELKAVKLVKRTYPALFSSLHADAADAEAGTESAILFSRLEEEITDKPALMQQVWNQLHVIGSRIWDGIRRTWRWFRAMLKRVAGRAVAWLGNIARLAYHYIINAYEAMQMVIRGVDESIRFFAQPVMRFYAPGHTEAPIDSLMIHDRDFDFRLLLDRSDSSELVNAMAGRLHECSAVFAISCRFLAELLDILVGLLRQGLLTGWVALLMALLKLYQSIHYWAPRLLAAQQE
ncbi:peptidoglycan-binding protein [Mariprofundus ferrooxydans]|uniref:peptidoglycan-binding protein n=1 Tax=Mariprofundus ferrooxydans TaxID=314344 RepID=UPI000378F3DC|nr:peptidoglycan-binding domain-containing protein [Mariprofundus ferrooxydans]